MSSKYKRPVPPRDPATLKVTRGDIINFMNFMSMDENFCLRVWNTVQNAHAKYKAAQEEAALRANAEERAAEKAEAAQSVPLDALDGGHESFAVHVNSASEPGEAVPA